MLCEKWPNLQMHLPAYLMALLVRNKSFLVIVIVSIVFGKSKKICENRACSFMFGHERAKKFCCPEIELFH